MSNSSSPARIPGLAALVPQYSVALCDVWGVVHNGVRSFEKARQALTRFRAEGGTVILITNAPRTSRFIVEQMAGLGVEPECYDAIVTSGDVTRALLAERGAIPALHIGAERDKTLYEGLPLTLTDAGEAQVISCTGLRDDTRETPGDYEAELAGLAARGLPMICANPDIVVERGNTMIWCAGALAQRYEALGGTTLVAGKPHRPIYEAALRRAAEIRGGEVDREAVIAIGDGAPTDLTGAVAQGLDVLFVTGGIHSASFGPADHPEASAVHRFLDQEALGARAFLPTLVW